MQIINNIKYFTREEVAAELHLPISTLNYWAFKKRGPAYYRFGKRIFYRESDINSFIESTRRGTQS